LPSRVIFYHPPAVWRAEKRDRTTQPTVGKSSKTAAGSARMSDILPLESAFLSEL
jgi:hypothetical protein